MKASVEALRALALYTALQFDSPRITAMHRRAPPPQARGDLLIPIVKGWSTEVGIEVAAIGIQVHGGMGFIEETGAAQYLRDVRITAIYEGTTGIQSNDLIGRKLGRDGGAAMVALLKDMEQELQRLTPGDAAARQARQSALEAVGVLAQATHSLLSSLSTRPHAAMAVSVPYLKLCGYVMGGWLWRAPRTWPRRSSMARRLSFMPRSCAPPPSTPRRCCRSRSLWRAWWERAARAWSRPTPPSSRLQPGPRQSAKAGE